MRTLFLILIVAVLTLAAGSVAAEPARALESRQPLLEPRNPSVEARGHTMLTLSPLFLDIHRINEEAGAAERALLTELAGSQDEERVLQLVSRLQRIETDRQIAIFKVRIRYARQEGRYDLASELRHRMVLLLQDSLAALM